MRQKIVAGNWKMNKTFQEAEDLMFEINEQLAEKNAKKVQVILCPPSVFLELAFDNSVEELFEVGAQNISAHESGAYTGEISAPMLKSMEVKYCIIGHSERRKYFNETDDVLALKVKITLKYDLIPIFCCGEQLADREKGNHFEVVRKQLKESLFDLDEVQISHVIIAYEPVWAIGTGLNATPGQAQEMHAFIRQLIKERYKQEVADQTTILYGGSCNSKNAAELFVKPDVDGGLIGGASLDASEFVKIIHSF